MKKNETREKKRGPILFLLDMLRGFGIGMAFIIPGFSGGSVAAILGIYEKLVGAVAGIFKSFKRNFLTLLPIFIGLVLGVLSLIKPIQLALGAFPLPTVSLFVGLALGGLPTVTDKLKGRIKPTNIIALVIPFIVTVGMSFLPLGKDVDLFNMEWWGYIILFAVGVIGSAALVVPGISGSMLLMMLGYYNPLSEMLTDHLFSENAGVAFATLAVTGVGIIAGFFGISVIMKLLFKKCPRGTYFAILGFILGSIPTIFITTANEAGYTLSTLPDSPWHWIACVLLLGAGFAGAFLFCTKVKKMNATTVTPKTNEEQEKM